MIYLPRRGSSVQAAWVVSLSNLVIKLLGWVEAGRSFQRSEAETLQQNVVLTFVLDCARLFVYFSVVLTLRVS